MKGLGKYKNGNYTVMLFDDGTKIRHTKEKKFYSIFPECIDLKITDFCDVGCPYCHENSTKDGKHAKWDKKFFDTLRPYTEIAVGGGNPLSHPDIIKILEYFKERKIIANITVNQKHFEKDFELIKQLVDDELIFGVGISIINVNDDFIEKVREIPNAVLHTINGVVEVEELEKLYNKNLKILVLGYKNFRRRKKFLFRKS